MVYALELADLDAKTVKAPNFAGGGAYAPSSVVVVGGAGMTLKLVGNNTISSGYLSIDGSSYLEMAAGSSATYGGASTFLGTSSTFVYSGASWTFDPGTTISTAGALNIAGSTTFQAGSFTNFLATVVFGSASSAGFLGTASFGNNVTFYSGTVTHNGSVLFNAYVGVSGSLDITGPLGIYGASGLHASLTATGAGRVVKRTAFIPTAGGGSVTAYGPANTDRVIYGALTGGVNLTINETGAIDGDEMTFVNKSGAFFLTISWSGGGFPLKNSVGHFRSCTTVRVSGQWIVLNAEAVTTEAGVYSS